MRPAQLNCPGEKNKQTQDKKYVEPIYKQVWLAVYSSSKRMWIAPMVQSQFSVTGDI